MCPLKTLKPFSTNWLCFHSTKLKAPFLWMCRKQSITTSGPKRKWCIRMELAQWALRMLWCEGFWFLDSCDPLLRYDCCNAHYSCVLQVWAASSCALPIMRQYTLAPLPCGRPLLLFLSLPWLLDLLSSSYAIFLPLHSRRAIIIHCRSHAISLFSTNHPFNSWNEEHLKGNSFSDSNPEITCSWEGFRWNWRK